MDPLTMALVAGGISAATSAPEMFKSDLEKEQKRRLDKLKREQEMGALGLDATEMQTMQDRYASKLGQGQAYADAQRRALLAGGGAQAGTALQQAQLAEQGAAQAQAQVQQAIMQADITERQQKEQEIIDLEAGLAQMKKDRQSAMVAPLGAAGGAYLQGQTFQQLAGLSPEKKAELAALGVPVPAASDPATEAIKGYMKQYGLSQEEAKKLYQDFDEADSYYMDLL